MSENTTPLIDSTTGEIVPAGDFAQRDIAADILSISENNGAFYTSMKGDDFDAKLAVGAAMTNAIRLRDNTNVTLAVKDLIIQEVELKNDQTGRLEKAPRITIVTADGDAYFATSVGIFNSARQLLAVAGEPHTWPKPVDMYAVDEGAGLNRFLTLKWGKAPARGK